jgi:hypothetical protein
MCATCSGCTGVCVCVFVCVCVCVRLRVRTILGPNPGTGRRSVPSPSSRPALIPPPPASYSMVPVAVYSGVNQPECEVDHSPPRSPEVKNECVCTSASPRCSHGVSRDNFTDISKYSWYRRYYFLNQKSHAVSTATLDIITTLD